MAWMRDKQLFGMEAKELFWSWRVIIDSRTCKNIETLLLTEDCEEYVSWIHIFLPLNIARSFKKTLGNS